MKNLICLASNVVRFVAAHTKLKKPFKGCQTEIINDCALDGIDCQSISPYSPHFGGLWEGGFKASKRHQKRVLRHACLTFEELNTVLMQIKATLNSRYFVLATR